MGKLISVIVPVYNVEPYLEKCINSIINQTYRDIEILLIDDGSTDKCGEICDRYAKNYDNITTFHKKNGGLSDARNFGIEKSTGDFLIFLDSDDFVSEQFIEHLFGLISSDGEIGICDLSHCIYGKKTEFTTGNRIVKLNNEEAIIEMLYQKSFLVSACGKIFPKSLFDNFTFKVGIHFEDAEVMYKLFDKATGIVYSNAKLYGYMHRENSITTSKFSCRDLDILDICNEIDRYFEDRSNELRRAAKAYHSSAAFRIYLNAPKGREFDEYIQEAQLYLKKNAKSILKDKNVRNKNKIALFIFKYFEFIMPYIYKKIDRWK